MKSIILEVRDRGTLIPVMATYISDINGETVEENKLISRAGYGHIGMTILTILESGKSSNDPFKWDESRTMHNAHFYIHKNFNKLKSGDVIDVEFILGETNVKKKSEINSYYNS